MFHSLLSLFILTQKKNLWHLYFWFIKKIHQALMKVKEHEIQLTVLSLFDVAWTSNKLNISLSLWHHCYFKELMTIWKDQTETTQLSFTGHLQWIRRQRWLKIFLKGYKQKKYLKKNPHLVLYWDANEQRIFVVQKN